MPDRSFLLCDLGCWWGLKVTAHMVQAWHRVSLMNQLLPLLLSSLLSTGKQRHREVSHWSTPSWWTPKTLLYPTSFPLSTFLKKNFNSFIEVWFTYCKSRLFQVYGSVSFRVYIVVPPSPQSWFKGLKFPSAHSPAIPTSAASPRKLLICFLSLQFFLCWRVHGNGII